MNVEELKESTEHAHNKGEKAIGLTMTIVAVLLAAAVLMSHRAHTEVVVLQTKVNDQWSYYQAKNIRSHMYAADARLAGLAANGKELATDFSKDSEKQKKESEDVRKEAEKLDNEAKLLEHRANYYDSAELFLEISIVLCSVALLAELKLFWHLSFITTILGIGLALWGILGVH
ncbi:MAG TPA: DUF4337 domain-containing protein [Candidatus Angelobacter sp.]|nr:DUF4337 domain-containing protein [Candidatus Angelobacter sp.]